MASCSTSDAANKAYVDAFCSNYTIPHLLESIVKNSLHCEMNKPQNVSKCYETLLDRMNVIENFYGVSYFKNIVKRYFKTSFTVIINEIFKDVIIDWDQITLFYLIFKWIINASVTENLITQITHDAENFAKDKFMSWIIQNGDWHKFVREYGEEEDIDVNDELDNNSDNNSEIDFNANSDTDSGIKSDSSSGIESDY